MNKQDTLQYYIGESHEYQAEVSKLESRIQELEAEIVRLKRDGSFPKPRASGFVVSSEKDDHRRLA